VGIVFTLASLLVNLGLVALAFWNAKPVRAIGWACKDYAGISKIVALLLAAIACQPDPSRLEYAALTWT